METRKEGWDDYDPWWYAGQPGEPLEEPKPEVGGASSATTRILPLVNSALFTGPMVRETDDATQIVMAVTTKKYNKYINAVGSTDSSFRRLLVDSGAQCCVCPRDYAPEIEVTELPEGRKPELRTASGTKMEVYGIKYVAYKLSATVAIKIKYYVCDVHGPILSTGGMIRSGYSVVLDRQSHVRLNGWFACRLLHRDGLHFLIPLRRWGLRGEQDTLLNGAKLVAATTDKDYWKIEGDKAIRFLL